MLEGPVLEDGSRRVTVTSGQTFRESGTGLGLEQCNLEITMNGGTFEVFSTPDKGSKFIITLPIYNIETSKEIMDRMHEKILSLIESWDKYFTKEERKERGADKALFAAKALLSVYFKMDDVGNILNRISGSLVVYNNNKKHNLPQEFINEAFEICDNIIDRFDNTQIDRLRDDERFHEIAESLDGLWGITKEDIVSIDTLDPGQIRSLIQPYIDDLKPVMRDLKKDYHKLVQAISRDNAGMLEKSKLELIEKRKERRKRQTDI